MRDDSPLYRRVRRLRVRRMKRGGKEKVRLLIGRSLWALTQYGIDLSCLEQLGDELKR